MTNTNRLTAALILSVAATGIAAPAFGQSSFDSSLRAVAPELAARAAQRSAIIRACNEAGAPLREYTWGNEQSDRYRACMAQHGQIE